MGLKRVAATGARLAFGGLLFDLLEAAVKSQSEPAPRMDQVADALQGLLNDNPGHNTHKPKRKVSRYNRLLKAEMKKMKNSRMKGKAKFSKAAKSASRLLKAERKKKDGKKKRR